MKNNLGVCIIVTNTNKQVLLGKRKNSYKAGTYGLPGGRVHFSESLIEAANRELKEETGLQGNLKYLGAVRETQEDQEFIHFIYSLEEVNTEPELLEPDKCEKWEWLGLDSNKEILRGHKAALELLNNSTKLIDLTKF